MNISIAIADINRDYLERLAEVLQEYEDLTVSIFTSAERLEQALQLKKFDIVLFNPDICEKKLVFTNVKLCMCLYGEEVQNTEMYADLPKVMKYQRVSKIYKEIIKVYAEQVSDWGAFASERSTRMIAVYSPVGGSGKTVMALAIASKVEMQDKQALFVSTEQLQSFSGADTDADERITALIEALGENVNFELKLKGITKEGFNGISCIEGFEKIVDYNTISKEEMSMVLDKIKKFCKYDVVVVDMGSNMDAIGQAVFEMADGIVVIERPGETAESKIGMFAQQALVCEHIKKMYKIYNFADKNSSGSRVLDAPFIGRVYNYGNQPIRNILQTVCANDEIDVSKLLR